MASIRSVLIKTCMANIHKEISQLEHWLINLPNESEPSKAEVSCSKHQENPPIDLQRLYDGIERMNQQLNFQQITLAHITDRIEILENFRDIHIEEKEETSPWLTDAVDLDEEKDAPLIHVIHLDESNKQVVELKNEIIIPPLPLEEDQPIPLLNPKEEKPVAKEEPVAPTHLSAKETEVHVTHLEDQNQPKEMIVNDQPVNEKDAEEQNNHQEEEEPKEEEPEEEVQEVQEEEEPKEEEPKEEEPEEEVQEEEEPKEEEPKEEEPEEEVQEEEEMEGTVFEYKDVTYYRDLENHVFAVDENGELSDMAIGFWKEKTQTILFYKMK